MILIFSGILLVMFFKNPNPCNTSGTGCRSVWELLSDSCAVVVGVMMTIAGMFLTIVSMEVDE